MAGFASTILEDEIIKVNMMRFDFEQIGWLQCREAEIDDFIRNMEEGLHEGRSLLFES